MERIFEIASKVANPLAISGFVIVAMLYIFKWLINKDFFPKLKQEQGYLLFRKIINVVLIIGIIGIVLGISAFIIVQILEKRYPSLKRDYVEINTPGDLPLNGIIQLASRNFNVTIHFNENCDSSVQKAIIEEGDYKGDNMKEFLEKIQQRVKGKSISYTVAQEGESRYEIICR